VPELPDVALYVEALERRILGHELEGVRLKSAFLLRSAVPPLATASTRSVTGLRRLGKRIAIALGPRPDGSGPPQLHLLLHLMIAGRLHWKARGAALTKRTDLAAFDFDAGSLVLTEAGTKKRASLFVLADEVALAAHDRGGLEPLACTLELFAQRLALQKHTLKRALCEPRFLSGVGNAYSDEILHRARLSPLRLARQLDSAEVERLHAGLQSVLREWLERLRAQAGERFPEKVTAFRPEMAVHGRFGLPCPVCAAPVQRIVRAENEVNYCARCQTGGRLLKDRALSVLLKDDWPSTLEELEEREPPGAASPAPS